MSVLAAMSLLPPVGPVRSVLDSRSNNVFTMFCRLSTTSTIAQVRPFFTQIVAGFVVRFQMGFLKLVGRSLLSKSNSPTPSGRGGNYDVFTYPYSVLWSNPAYKSLELKSATTSILIRGGPNTLLSLTRSTELVPT